MRCLPCIRVITSTAVALDTITVIVLGPRRVRFHVMPRPFTIATAPVIVVPDVYRCLLFLMSRVLFRTPPHPPCVIFSSVACAIASLPSKMRYRCPKSGWFNESLDSCYASSPQFKGVLSAPHLRGSLVHSSDILVDVLTTA